MTKTFPAYKAITAADVEVGDEVIPIYLTRPMGGVGGGPKRVTVKTIGPKWITLSDNTKVESNGAQDLSWIGIILASTYTN